MSQTRRLLTDRSRQLSSSHAIPVVDLFAGPGGLGEGFCSLVDQTGNRAFKCVLAVEHELHSHDTLTLRHFFRSFPPGAVPDEYYAYISGLLNRNEMYESYPKQYMKASRSAIRLSLSKSNRSNLDYLMRKALNGSKLWVLMGGPPCQAYSLAGRSRMKGNPAFEKDHRHFLYKEYLHTLAEFHPPVFVLENVKGLLSASMSGESTITRISEDLRKPGKTFGNESTSLRYRLYSFVTPGEVKKGVTHDSFIVRSERYGVPQARHRILILGIREDFDGIPKQLVPSPKPTTVGEVLRGLPKLRSGVTSKPNDIEAWIAAIRAFPIKEVAAEFGKTERGQKVVDKLVSVIERIDKAPKHQFSRVYRYHPTKTTIEDWLHDGRINKLSGHEARGHMESDLHRYLFASAFALEIGASPKLSEFPAVLLPKHRNVHQSLNGGMFADRFRVQRRDAVSTTITSHISKDGHYYIHFDPFQCRSLTVREAARLQTFPDNYHFEGPRTAQFHQIGNAVPPFLARQLAEVVYDLFIIPDMNGD